MAQTSCIVIMRSNFHYVCLACLGLNRSNLPLDLEAMHEHNSSFHGPGRKSVNKFNLDLGVVSQLEYTNATFYFAVDLKSDIAKLSPSPSPSWAELVIILAFPATQPTHPPDKYEKA